MSTSGYSPLVSLSSPAVSAAGGLRPLSQSEVRSISAQVTSKVRLRRLSTEEPSTVASKQPTSSSGWEDFVLRLIDTHSLLIAVVVAILLAAAYPPLGCNGRPLYTEYTVSYGATITIFFLMGVYLQVTDIAAACSDAHFAVQVLLLQTYNLILIPFITWAVCLCLRYSSISGDLIDGIVITACLPTTISSCAVLTSSAGGNELLAIAMATIGNSVGVVLSPVLIGLFLQDAGVSLEDTSRIGSIYLSLFVKVWVPLLCGLAVKSPLVKNAVPSVVDAFKHNKKAFKKTQELMLALIVYRTFAQSFASTESLASASDTASVFFIELAFISLFIPGIWLLTCSPVMFTDKDRVAALYSAPQKTIALGIPLINEMFSGRPNVGVLVLPLLMYHPLQLIIGSLLVPVVKRHLLSRAQIAPVSDEVVTRWHLRR